MIALCAIYELKAWRKVLILITAFTIGHSITLALATLKIIHLRSDIVELLIPITILFTALSNYFQEATGEVKTGKIRYVSAVIFGLIHGLGFSSYLQSLLGDTENIIPPLFAFNLGLEIGQLIILSVSLLVSTFFVEIVKVQRFTWNHLISGIVAGMALSLLLKNELLKGILA